MTTESLSCSPQFYITDVQLQVKMKINYGSLSISKERIPQELITMQESLVDGVLPFIQLLLFNYFFTVQPEGCQISRLPGVILG